MRLSTDRLLNMQVGEKISFDTEQVERVPGGWIFWREATISGEQYHDVEKHGPVIVPWTAVFVPDKEAVRAVHYDGSKPFGRA